MKKIKLYHGTSKESYDNIIKNGFSSDKKMVWNCSYEEGMHFFDIRKGDGDNIKDKINDCIYNGFFSAGISASVQNSLSNELYVFELSIDSDFIEDDYSCKNMSEIASYVDCEYLKLSDITAIYKAIDFYSPALKLAHLASVYDSEYLNIELSKIEQNAMEVLNFSDLDIFEDLEWNTINV